MPMAPKWEEMEDYIQALIDKAVKSRTVTIIEGLELSYRLEGNKLKKPLKNLRFKYGYFDDLY